MKWISVSLMFAVSGMGCDSQPQANSPKSTDSPAARSSAESEKQPAASTPKKPAAETQTLAPTGVWFRVGIRAEGYAPEEIERDIARQVEETLRSIEEIDRIETVSYPGEMVAWLRFEPTADSAAASRKIAEALSQVACLFPVLAEEPELRRVGSGPILLLALRRTSIKSNETARAICQAVATLQTRIPRIPQVADVFALGPSNLRFEVLIDTHKLQAFGITSKDLADRLQQQFVRVPGTRPSEQAIVQSLENQATIESMESMPIRAGADGSVTRLRDVAAVRMRVVGLEESPIGPASENWPNGLVLLGCRIDAAENADDCTKAIQKVVASVNLPAGVETVREWKDHERTIEIARKSWSRLLPPNQELEIVTEENGTYLIPTRFDLICHFIGPDLADLRSIAEDCQKLCIDQENNVKAEIVGGETEAQPLVHVDREKAAELGITTMDVSEFLLTVIDRHVVGFVDIEGLPAEIAISVLGKAGTLRDRLAATQIRLPDGKSVPLQQICTISKHQGPVEIRRFDRQRSISLRITRREDTVANRKAIQSRLSKYEEQLKQRNSACRIEWERESAAPRGPWLRNFFKKPRKN